MPTSSITKPFIIDNEKDCRNFINAIEKSKRTKTTKPIKSFCQEVSGEEINRLFDKYDNILPVSKEKKVPLLGEANCNM